MIAWLKRIYCRVFGHRDDWDYGNAYWHCARCGHEFERPFTDPTHRQHERPSARYVAPPPVTNESYEDRKRRHARFAEDYRNTTNEEREQAEQARLDILLGAIREDMAHQRVVVVDDSPTITSWDSADKDSGSGFGGGGASDSWTPDTDTSTPDIDPPND